MAVNIDYFDTKGFQDFLCSESVTKINVNDTNEFEKIAIGGDLVAVTDDSRGKTLLAHQNESRTKDWFGIYSKRDPDKFIYNEANFFGYHSKLDSLPLTWVSNQEYCRKMTMLVLDQMMKNHFYGAMFNPEYLSKLLQQRKIHGTQMLDIAAVKYIFEHEDNILQEKCCLLNHNTQAFREFPVQMFSFGEITLSFIDIDQTIAALANDCMKAAEEIDVLSRFWPFILQLIAFELTFQTVKTLLGSSEKRADGIEVRKKIEKALLNSSAKFTSMKLFFTDTSGKVFCEAAQVNHDSLLCPTISYKNFFLGIYLKTPYCDGREADTIIPCKAVSGKLIPWDRITKILADEKIIYRK